MLQNTANYNDCGVYKEEFDGGLIPDIAKDRNPIECTYGDAGSRCFFQGSTPGDVRTRLCCCTNQEDAQNVNTAACPLTSIV